MLTWIRKINLFLDIVRRLIWRRVWEGLFPNNVGHILIEFVALLRCQLVDVKLDHTVLTRLKTLNYLQTTSERRWTQISKSSRQIIFLLIRPRFVEIRLGLLIWQRILSRNLTSWRSFDDFFFKTLVFNWLVLGFKRRHNWG